MCKSLSLLLFFLSFCLFAEIPFILNGQGKNSFIVVDRTMTPTAQFAARELADYIEKTTGVNLLYETGIGKANLNIIVGFGEHARKAGLTLDGIAHDGFRIVTRGNNLYIYGRDRETNRPILGGAKTMTPIHIYNAKYDICAHGDSGTLYGVYYFLREYLGIRWFAPGELGEVCPKTQDLLIPDIDITVNPDFEYRTPYLTLFNYSHDVALWYRRAGFGAYEPVEINHSFYLMNRFQKEHPEWFALLEDGSRDFNTTCEGRGNLCLAQPGLLQAFIDDARRYFDEDPVRQIFCVMPNDWFNQICQCPDCQAQAEYDKPFYGKFSNYVWKFVNDVAREVRKTHPDKFIGCCAYNSYMLPPDKVELEPNIAVMMCKALYFRFDDFYRMRNDELTYEWGRKTRRFYVWEYYCWNTTNPHLTGLPIIFSHWLQNDLRKLKGICRGEFIDVAPMPPRYQMNDPALNSLNLYLTGRLMWDTSLDVDELLDDYCDKFFGPAATDMRLFWQFAEELWTNMDVKKRGPGDNLNETLYTKEALERLKSYLLDAQSRVSDDSDFGRRIRQIQNSFFPYLVKLAKAEKAIPSAEIPMTDAAPVIDGQAEALWQKAPELPFVEWQSGGKPQVSTKARLLHDKENLYVLVECDAPNAKNLTAKCRQNDHDEIWLDDTVEIFLVPDDRILDRNVQIGVNPAGIFWDACRLGGNPNLTDASFNTGLTVRCNVQENGWTMELALPLKSLTLKGNPCTDHWRVNLCRDHHVPGIDTTEIDRSAWSAPF